MSVLYIYIFYTNRRRKVANVSMFIKGIGTIER